MKSGASRNIPFDMLCSTRTSVKSTSVFMLQTSVSEMNTLVPFSLNKVGLILVLNSLQMFPYVTFSAVLNTDDVLVEQKVQNA